MATAIIMPKLGNTVEECLLASWSKQVGDAVKTGDVIAEIETDKTAAQVEATADGVLLELFWEEGELVPVLVNLCAVGEEGEDVSALRPEGSEAEAAPAEAPAESAEPAPAAPVAESAAPAAPAAVEGQAPLSPRAKSFLKDHPFNMPAIQGSGAGGRIMEKDVAAAYASSSRLSPVAVAMAADGVAAPAAGSGVGGMIMGSDMGQAAAAPVAESAAAAPAAPVEGKPLSMIRKVIAERMVGSLTTAAQYTINGSADATGMLAMRAKIKAAGESLGLANININDMVCYATVCALKQMPELNAHFTDGKVYQRPEINLGFAVDTSRGLMVPVTRNCQSMSLNDFALALKGQIGATIDGTINPDDLGGGTFTISSLGSLGVSSFTPVINAPEVAILGVCATELKPVRVNGEVVFRDYIQFSLTCDHRVIDGAPAARFMATLKNIIENIELMCLAQ